MDTDASMSKLKYEETFFELPSGVVKKARVLEDVLTFDTFSNFTEEQKTYLMKFLPKETSENELRSLFDGTLCTAFSSEMGNADKKPIKDFTEKLSSNYFSLEMNCVRKARQKAMHAKHLLNRHLYYQNILKQLMVKNWKELPNRIVNPSKASSSSDSKNNKKDVEPKVKERCRKQYSLIINKVRRIASLNSSEDQKVELSSDSESEDEKTWQHTSKAIPINYQGMLATYQKKKALDPNSPEFNMENITLMDIVNRSFSGSKKSALLKTSMQNRKRRAVAEPLATKKKKVKLLYSNKKSIQTKLNMIKQTAVKNLKRHFPMRDTKSQSSGKGMGIMSATSFFSFIHRIIVKSGDRPMTVKDINSEVANILQGDSVKNFSWYGSYDVDWITLTEKALKWLSTKHENFDQMIEMDSNGLCKWVGKSEYINSCLQIMCGLWLKQMNVFPNPPQTNNIESDEGYIVNSADLARELTRERFEFQEQERERYNKPHKAYLYKIDGKTYPVGPVKGMFTEGSYGKARGHILLHDDRPSYVTILTLTRDAVARLPNGEGTRNDICSLLRDSQYLQSDISDVQINSVVSSALDRLHYEVDPCVKYNQKLKLWFYLHGSRSTEELEHRHAVNALNGKSRKAAKDKTKKLAKNKPDKEICNSKTSTVSKNENSISVVTSPQVHFTASSNKGFTASANLQKSHLKPIIHTKPSLANVVSQNNLFSKNTSKNIVPHLAPTSFSKCNTNVISNKTVFTTTNAAKFNPTSVQISTFNSKKTETISSVSKNLTLNCLNEGTKNIKNINNLKLLNKANPVNKSEIKFSTHNQITTGTLKIGDTHIQKNVKLILRPVSKANQAAARTIASTSRQNINSTALHLPIPSKKIQQPVINTSIPVINKSPLKTESLVSQSTILNPVPQRQPGISFAHNSNLTKQQIQTEALRKLTEQLSAVSKRPIKIVHQSSLTPAENAAGTHVINIGQGGELTLRMANKAKPENLKLQLTPEKQVFSNSSVQIANNPSPISNDKLIMVPGVRLPSPRLVKSPLSPPSIMINKQNLTTNNSITLLKTNGSPMRKNIASLPYVTKENTINVMAQKKSPILIQGKPAILIRQNTPTIKSNGIPISMTAHVNTTQNNLNNNLHKNE